MPSDIFSCIGALLRTLGASISKDGFLLTMEQAVALDYVSHVARGTDDCPIPLRIQEGFARDIGGAQVRIDQAVPNAVTGGPGAIPLDRGAGCAGRRLDRIDHEAVCLCQRIAAIPGVGAMTATAMVAAVGDAKAFKNGRHLAAWIGLVPRQNSSGGKSRLLGISKRGDAYLRTLLIHGARSVLIRVACKHDARSVWFQDLIARRGYNRATVALANKNARITQSVLSGESNYRPSGVAG